MKKNSDEINIKDLLGVFVPKLWIIMLVAVLLAGVFGIYTAFVKQDTYTSYTSIYVYKSDNAATSADINAAQDMFEVYEYIIRTDNVLQMVIDKMPSDYADKGFTPAYLRSVIDVSLISNTGILKISVTTPDPSLSYDIAASAEKVLPSEIISSIPNTLLLTVFEEPDFAVKNDKGLVKNVLIGFVAGFLVAAIFVLIFALLDVVVHDKKKLEDNFNIPILGSIPHSESEVTKEGASQ